MSEDINLVFSIIWNMKMLKEKFNAMKDLSKAQILYKTFKCYWHHQNLVSTNNAKEKSFSFYTFYLYYQLFSNQIFYQVKYHSTKILR